MPPARDQIRYDLSARLREGHRWSFEISCVTRTQATFSGGDAADQTVETEEVLFVRGTAEALRTELGHPVAVRVSFDPRCSSWWRQGESELAHTALDLAENTYTIERRPDGEIVHDYHGSCPHTAAQLTGLVVRRSNGFRPLGPAALGDEWLAVGEGARETFLLKPTDRGSIRCKFLSVTTYHGRDVAEIEIKANVSRSASLTAPISPAIRAEVSATAYVDLQSGQFLTMKMNLQSRFVPGDIPLSCTGAATARSETLVWILPSAEAVPDDA
jgi:hypothetical protein